MILSKNLIDKLAAEVKDKGRLLDYYLIQNLFNCNQNEIIEELKNYQNIDGGFGHGLEPDVLMPDSSIVCTDEAVEILDSVEQSPLKIDLIKNIVMYYEKTYKSSLEGWEIVPPQVDNYPHAIWWNYDSIGNFTYGNPNPQIIGFLHNNREFVNTLDVDYLVNKTISYIKNKLLTEASKHNILSCLIFYKYMPSKIQEELYPILQVAIDNELKETDDNDYALEAYEIQLIVPVFLEKHQNLLQKNLASLYKKMQNGLIQPNWSWLQYLDVFEKIKAHWAGYLTYKVLTVLLKN
ncbi:MAG: hypothetical protein KAU02_04365 [Tenericutes bacterium]|nr:hypothetical protein [Mycoplasmatota bacterium]